MSEAVERVAIIGGTGVADLPDLDTQRQVVDTPYGSVAVLIAQAEPHPVVFLNRHGLHREHPPHRINYRGNLAALRMLGVSRILATNAVGSINRALPPGSLMVIDDYLDFTAGRANTFFDGEAFGHAYTEMSTPCCPALRARLLALAARADLPIHPGGVYVCTNGPRFETPAEIRMFAQLGADVVGMTGMPEVVLARELGMHYAAVAYSINWAAGIEAHVEIVRAGIPELLRRLLNLMVQTVQAADAVDDLPPCRCTDPLMLVRPAQEGGGIYRQ